MRKAKDNLERKVAELTAELQQTNERLRQAHNEFEEKVKQRTAVLAKSAVALQRSQKDLNRAQEVGQMGNWRINVRHNILNWSDEAHRIFGVPKGIPLTYETFLEIVHPDDRKAVDKVWKAALRGEPYDLEHRIVVDGRVKWVREKAYLEFDEGGKAQEGFGITQDITDRKQVEEALWQQAQLLHLSYDAIIVWRRDGGIEQWNRGAEQLYGFTEREVMGRVTHKLLKTIHPMPWPEIEAAMRKYGQWEGELRHCAKDGHEVIVSARHQLMLGIDGIERVLETNRDVTDRKQAEEALRESERRFHQLFEEDLTGDFLCTREGCILLCNAAFADIFGFSSADAAVGTSMLELYVDPGERDSILTILRAQGKLAYYESWRKRLDGTPVHIVENLVGHFNEKGELYEIQGYVFADTDRKRAEEALRELNATLEIKVAQRTEELERRARLLQKMALELAEAEERERKRLADILHDDLQQVLVAAKFHVESLMSQVSKDAEARETTEQARELLVAAIDRSRTLSHEISSPALAQENLGRIFEWLARQMETKHGFTVHLEIGDRIEVASEQHRFLLYKVAQEMLFNVIKHSGVREARLHLRRQRGLIRLAVSDRGRGFDPADSSHAFGSGLPSIRERVECLGGRLKIRSAPGKGSTFIVAVPDGNRSLYALTTDGGTSIRP